MICHVLLFTYRFLCLGWYKPSKGSSLGFTQCGWEICTWLLLSSGSNSPVQSTLHSSGLRQFKQHKRGMFWINMGLSLNGKQIKFKLPKGAKW